VISDPEVQRALATYQLGLPRMPPAGRSGELLGRGVGSSVEFQEYRQYVPGDDIRHLDWGAYARSDTLMVRLFRDEISPRTDLLLDGSRSMLGSGPPELRIHKARVAKQLTTLFARLVARLGGRPKLFISGDGPAVDLPLEQLHRLTEWPFSGQGSLSDQINEGLVPLRRQSIRIVVSDFLFPHDPVALVRRLAGDASTLWIVQLLSGFEADPRVVGGKRLVDGETGAELDLVIDDTAIARYKERLKRLQGALAAACRQFHARYATVTADAGLAAICRGDLCPTGMLRAD
jgi:uncharacterized protein (DUF58 family)